MHRNLYIFFSIALLVMSSAVETRAQNIDSLKLALKNAKHDTTRIKILSELSEICDEKDILQYAMPCVSFCEKGLQKSDTSTRWFYLFHLSAALNNIGFLANQQGDMSKALKYYQKSLLINKEIRDKMGTAGSLNNIGSIYQQQGDISKALDCFHRSLKIQDEIKDKKAMAYCLVNIGAIYSGQGDIPNALEYYHRSLKVLEEIKDKKGMAASYNNIASIYNDQGDIPQALEYYYKSLKILEEIRDKKGIAQSLNNIGVIYYNKLHDNHKALEFFHKGLKIREEIKDKYGIAQSLNSIASSFYDDGNFPGSLNYFLKSLKTREEIKDKQGIANTASNIAKVLLELGEISDAIKYAKYSMATAKELGFPDQINRAAKSLKRIYKKQNKFKDALEMYELEILMRDSINNAETKKASIKKQFQYQYEKKAAADSVKNSEEQKVKNAQLTAQQAQLKQEKTQRFALYGGLVIIIIFLGVVFNRFRITQKQKVVIEKQKAEVDNAFRLLHEKNKEVMDSIYYARRIQRSLLPSESYIARQLSKLGKSV